MLDDELTGHLSTLFDVGLLGLLQITNTVRTARDAAVLPVPGR